MSASNAANEQRIEAEERAKAFLVSDAVLPSIALLLSNDWAYADLIAGIQSPRLPLAVLDAVQSFVDSGDVNGTSEPDPHWHLIAQALAIVAATGPPDAARLVACSKRLDDALPWAIDVWLDACALRIASLDVSTRAEWTAALGASPSIISQGPSSSYSVTVSRIPGRWEVADALELWSEQPVAFHEIATWPPSNVLYRLDRDLWFAEIDRWTDPRLVQAALFYLASKRQQEELLQFLGSARPCFALDGQLVPSSSAIVLCDAALRLAEDLHASDGPEGASSFLARFVRTLLDRSDGTPLALALASRVFDLAILSARTFRPSRPVAQLAWDALLAAFVEKPVSVEEHRKLYILRSTPGSGRRESVRCELPALLVARATSTRLGGTAAAPLSEWLKDALTRKEEWARADLVNVYFHEIAKIWELSPDPCSSCRAAFEGLERQRRRAEFGHSLLEHYFEVPSLLLLLALCSLVQQGHGADPEGDLTYVCERATRIERTATGFDNPLFPALEVVSSAACVAVARFGPQDPRTLSLVRNIAAQREAVGYLFCKLVRILDAASTLALLSTVGVTPQTLTEDTSQWSSATQLPSDKTLADEVVKAVARLEAGPASGPT